ncbi:hypothetical protein ACTXT7_008607 [Hymenolepis weldensis]
MSVSCIPRVKKNLLRIEVTNLSVVGESRIMLDDFECKSATVKYVSALVSPKVQSCAESPETSILGRDDGDIGGSVDLELKCSGSDVFGKGSVDDSDAFRKIDILGVTASDIFGIGSGSPRPIDNRPFSE